ncbi:MAG: ferredoxin, partial [Nocardiopsaceae bacterium]|nr:ferredoxin [Nocardiopsaceae bacterium]
LVARSVQQAASAEPALRRLVEVVQVSERFSSGESSALINAINGKPPLPAGRKSHASSSGVAGRPTLLSNAETFAQLAVLAMVGSEGYASTGIAAEPGTVLLTVGGAADHPAVVEVPSGASLGDVLDACGARPEEGVLVGGYHGSWLTADEAYEADVSRSGMMAFGATLGAGVILALGEGSCPIGEVARVAAYLAKESSGQCGPCKLGLPNLARSVSAVAAGTGGVEELDALRKTAASVRGRGACSHPDGTTRFVLSALDVFADDLAEHFFRGGCGRPVKGYLPLPAADGEQQLTVDWTRCDAHGLCAHIVPELVQLDQDGFPVVLEMHVPRWLDKEARQAVEMCPALALRLTEAKPGNAPAPAPRVGLPARALARNVKIEAAPGYPLPRRALPGDGAFGPAVPRRPVPPRPSMPERPAIPMRPAIPARRAIAAGPAFAEPPISRQADVPPEDAGGDERVLTGKIVDFAVTEDWIAELGSGCDPYER